MGIEGNEAADKLAKAAADDATRTVQDTVATVSYARRASRARAKEVFDSWWIVSRPDRYQRWNLMAKRKPPELNLP